MGHGHALSAAAVQSRCLEVAGCWRVGKSRSRMRKRGKKGKKGKIGWPGAIRQFRHAAKTRCHGPWPLAVQCKCQEVASCWRMEKSTVENEKKSGKKEKEENEMARCHPAVSKCGKNWVSAAMGHGHALSAEAVQSRCREVAICGRVEKNKSKMEKKRGKGKRGNKVARCHLAVLNCGRN